MLKNIRIAGYKCLRECDLPLANLNLFVGPNAAGKSSVLQILLLLRQSSSEKGIVPRLTLNGDLYDGGTVSAILHPDAGDKIACHIQTGEEDHTYQFVWERSRDDYLDARALPLEDHAAVLPLLPELSGSNFIYLNAERRAPDVRYPLQPDGEQLAGELGKHGEFTTAMLARSKDRMVDQWGDADAGFGKQLGDCAKQLDDIELAEALADTNGQLDLVANQILGWIIPGSAFHADEVRQTDNAVLHFIRDGADTKMPVRPTHIGFGLTYALPVIAAGLALRTGGVLIVENPEAHLHPFSQSRMGVFLALAAAAGRQVFIETHSDHVINGIRLAIAKGYLTAEQLQTHFFKRPHKGTTARIETIACDNAGRMSAWPSGFFDQIETDLAML